MTSTATCSICGAGPLAPGPMDRLSLTGQNPHCRACESLERHRVIHQLMRALPNGFLNWRRAIQFSGDPSIEQRWFRSLEVSEYGGTNSIDAQAIERPDHSFDFISINHVLESVPDDRKAFAELTRVLSPGGFMQATFGGVTTSNLTVEFDVPKAGWKAFRRYGRDVLQRLGVRELGLTVLPVFDVDPSTQTVECVHFLFRNYSDAARVRGWISLWSQTARFEEM